MTVHRLQLLNQASIQNTQSVWKFYATCLSVVGFLALLNIGLSVTTMYNRVASNNSSTASKTQELTLELQNLHSQLASETSLETVRQQASAEGFQAVDPSQVSYWSVPTTNAVAQR